MMTLKGLPSTYNKDLQVWKRVFSCALFSWGEPSSGCSLIVFYFYLSLGRQRGHVRLLWYCSCCAAGDNWGHVNSKGEGQLFMSHLCRSISISNSLWKIIHFKSLTLVSAHHFPDAVCTLCSCFWCLGGSNNVLFFTIHLKNNSTENEMI